MLHAAAVLVGGILGLSLFLVRETVLVACPGVVYSIGWRFYCYRSAWGADSMPQAP